MIEGDMDTDMEESPESMETPMRGMISRKRLKKGLRRDQIEELYLATIGQMNDDTGINFSDQDASYVSDWIQKEYGPVLREELPPRMPLRDQWATRFHRNRICHHHSEAFFDYPSSR
jgi:hypothetical protein